MRGVWGAGDAETGEGVPLRQMRAAPRDPRERRRGGDVSQMRGNVHGHPGHRGAAPRARGGPHRKKRRLAPEEIKFLRKSLGWAGVDFAKHMGATPETVSRWETARCRWAPRPTGCCDCSSPGKPPSPSIRWTSWLSSPGMTARSPRPALSNQGRPRLARRPRAGPGAGRHGVVTLAVMWRGRDCAMLELVGVVLLFDSPSPLSGAEPPPVGSAIQPSVVKNTRTGWTRPAVLHSPGSSLFSPKRGGPHVAGIRPGRVGLPRAVGGRCACSASSRSPVRSARF